MARAHRTSLAALAWCLLAAPLSAQPAGRPAPGAWPRCVAERDGQQLGLGGSVCECGFERGGAMLGRPAGWRWSCDIMRSDEDQLDIPADSGGQPPPPDLTYSPQYGAQDSTQAQDSSGAPAATPDPSARRHRRRGGRPPTSLLDAPAR